MAPPPSTDRLRRLGYPISPAGGVQMPPAPRIPVEPPPLPEQFAQLAAMDVAQRVAAMYRGQLTLTQLCKWAAGRPDEMAVVDGEFVFIAAHLAGGVRAAPRPAQSSR